MDLTIFILQVMYYITSYIFGIIDINYDKLDVSWSTQTSWTPKSSQQRLGFGACAPGSLTGAWGLGRDILERCGSSKARVENTA